MKFAVIGGDMRQAKLAELLAADGHSVSTFAIDKIRLEGSVVQKTLIREAVDDAACVIMPLPVTSREGMLNAPLSSGLHTTREVLSVLRGDQVLCAGRIDCATLELACDLGITLVDYLEREELAVANAVAAAEGAIQLIMEETPITICHSTILVIGFGRIGKLLCHRLRGLGAHVTATARSCADLAWIKAYGYEAEETGRIDGLLSKFDVVVNTVPARVLGESRLSKVRPRLPLPGFGLQAGWDGFFGRLKARRQSCLGSQSSGRGRSRQLRRHHPRYDIQYPERKGRRAMSSDGINIGYAFCGSYCTFDKAIGALEKLCALYDSVTPIMSENAFKTNSRYGTAREFIDKIEGLCGKKIISTISEAEPIGPKALLDILVIAPCTGNTIAKLASG